MSSVSAVSSSAGPAAAASFVTCGEAVKLWAGQSPLAAPTVLAEIGNVHIYQPTCVMWNHNCQVIGSGADDGTIRLISASKLSVLVSFSHGEAINCLCFSESSRYLCSGSARYTKLWDLKTATQGKEPTPLKVFKNEHPVTAAVFDYDQKQLATASHDIHLHHLTDGTITRLTYPHPVTALAFNPNATRQLLAGDASGGVCLMDTEHMSRLAQHDNVHSGQCTGVAFPFGLPHFFSSSMDGTIVLHSGSHVAPLKIQTDAPVTCMDVMSSGYSVLAGDNRGVVRCYDFRKPRDAVWQISAHPGVVKSVQVARIHPKAKSKPKPTPGASDLMPMGRAAAENASSPQPSTVTARSAATASAPSEASSAASGSFASYLYASGAATATSSNVSTSRPLSTGIPAAINTAKGVMPPMSVAKVSGSTPPRHRSPPGSPTRSPRTSPMLGAATAPSAAGAPAPGSQNLKPTASAHDLLGLVKTLQPPVLPQAAPSRMPSGVSLSPPATPTATVASGHGGFTFSGSDADALRSVIVDAVEPLVTPLRQSIQNLHLELLRQAQIQSTELAEMLASRDATIANLIREVEELRRENATLKRMY